jgi:CheY-like chemotaxis protein
MPSRTILVVDDEHSLRETIRSVLEFEGYRVVTANNGREGIDLLKKILRPCLILLDIMMPNMDGRDFLDGLRSDPATASIPVVVISACEWSAGDTVARIAKPFRLETLLTTIQRHCA